MVAAGEVMRTAMPTLAGLAAVLLGLLLAGCSALFGTDYTLHVNNGTTLDLRVVVNGQAVGGVAARRGGVFPVGSLPPLPWNVEAHTVAGRVVLALAVAKGSIVDERALDGTGSYSAPAGRADLSCGRLDMYPNGEGPLGPIPGTGVPGDCVP